MKTASRKVRGFDSYRYRMSPNMRHMLEENGVEFARDVNRDLYILTFPNGNELTVDGIIFTPMFEKDAETLLDLWSC